MQRCLDRVGIADASIVLETSLPPSQTKHSAQVVKEIMGAIVHRMDAAMASAPFLDPKSIAGKPLSVREHADVAVIGGGPAGLSAAIAAAQGGLSVILVDENPIGFKTMGDDVPLHFGMGMSGAARNRNAMMEAFVASEPLIETAFEAGVDIRHGLSCFGVYSNGPAVGWLPGLVAGVFDEGSSWFIGAKHVIVAAGRRDMGLAFPGWELPGVMGATAATLLASRYDALGPRRVVLLGTTTEALVAAALLRSIGVEIVAVVEQSAAPVGRAVFAEGAEILTGHVVREVTGRDGVEAVLVTPVSGDCPERRIACDGVILGVGITPVIDLLSALGCQIAFQPERGGYTPVLGPDQRTSMAGVYAVGDCAGIWPSKTLDRSTAEAEGRCAACAILSQHGVETEAPVVIAPDVAGYDISEYRLGWVRASIVEARADCYACPAPPGLDEHWDSWFGMHGQWRPFWDVPEFYTVAGNMDGGPAVSE